MYTTLHNHVHIIIVYLGLLVHFSTCTCNFDQIRHECFRFSFTPIHLGRMVQSGVRPD